MTVCLASKPYNNEAKCNIYAPFVPHHYPISWCGN